MALRKSALSRVQTPCLKLPLRSPWGPPEPLAPPCIRHRARPVTAACLQGGADRGRGAQLRALARVERRLREVMLPAPGFATLTRGDLRLVLSAPHPAAGGGQPKPDGR